MTRFFIPYTLPSLNEIIASKGSTNGAKGQRWYKYTSIKRDAIDATAIAVRGMPPLDNVPHDYSFVWYCKNRRKDPDNIAAGVKFIFDGLVRSGIICNDGWDQVRRIDHAFVPGPHDLYGLGVSVLISS